MPQHRILIIGVGSIGERHARCFITTQRADVAICEINAGLRRDVAERYDIVSAYDSLEAALDDPPDAAVICTPAHLHVPMALQLAEAGVPMLIEKPLSTSTDDVDRLQAIVAEKNLPVGVAYVMRMNPVLVSMRAAIHSGRFGDPVQLVAVSGQHFPLYRPAYREIYYNERATGGGAIQDALTHLVNAAQWFVGPVTKLAADAGHQVLDGVTVEDTVHLITRHGDVMGNFSLNQHQAANETSLTIICKKGVARLESHNSRWLSATEPGAEWTVEYEQQLERDDGFVAQANMFLDCLDGKNESACSLVEGLQTLRTNLAILDAANSGAWRTIDEHRS